MSKILFIGDPHLKISKLSTSKSFLAWVIEVIDKVQPDFVVNLGDTFDTHAVVRAEILGEFRAHAKQVIKRCPYTYVLGNHDMYKPKDSTYHALQTFKDISGFTVIDEIKNDDKNGITYVPFQIDTVTFPKKTLPICVAHQTFIGADFGFYRPDDGVEPSEVSADIIISGHIHRRQSFDKVIYPGTPFAQGIDDINQSKGLMLFDLDTYDYSFIESPFPKWRGMRLDLTEMSIADVHNTIAGVTNSVDNWVIEINGPKVEVLGYMNSNEFMELKNGRSIRIKPEYTDKTKRENTKIKSITLSNIVDEYVDKVYSGSLDRGTIKNTAHEILNSIK